MTRQSTILVTGATGNVGRNVVAELSAVGADVRALVRRPAEADLPAGVEVARGDLTDPAGLDAALDGIDSVFLLWPFFTAEAAPAAVERIGKRARRVVYLSAMSVQDGREPDQNGIWGQIEHLVERAVPEWTFLRAGGFATNTLEWADQVRNSDAVRWCYGAAARSLIHERDIAAVAALGLTEDRHVGEKYVLTGPTTVTQAEQVHMIGEAIGRPLRWAELGAEEARQHLLTAWRDPGVVAGALAYWASLVDRPEPVTDTVQRVTGMPARTFRQWAIDHADDFRRRP